MWIFKGILFLTLLFFLVYFFMSNSDQTVDIRVLGTEYLGLSIYWVVVVSFLIGFTASFIIAAFREFRFHREIGRLKKVIQAKDREIADLRTLPLQETGFDPLAKELRRE